MNYKLGDIVEFTEYLMHRYPKLRGIYGKVIKLNSRPGYGKHILLIAFIDGSGNEIDSICLSKMQWL